jgi:hypothetical protein
MPLRPCGCECVGVDQAVRVASTNKDLVAAQDYIIYLCFQSHNNSADGKHGKTIPIRNLNGYVILHFPRSCAAMTSAVAVNV